VVEKFEALLLNAGTESGSSSTSAIRPRQLAV